MKRWLLLFLIVFVPLNVQADVKPQTKHVILISLDGFRPDAIKALGQTEADGFYDMMKEGVYTLNARTDFNYTVTLPNHTCMITGYPVMGPYGHGVTENGMTSGTVTQMAGHKVSSIFNVLKEHHRTSAMFSSKPKFVLYQRSFPIDQVALTNYDDAKTLDNFLKAAQKLPDFVFLHFAGPDRAGHHSGWYLAPKSEYMQEIRKMNSYIKKIMKTIAMDRNLATNTVIILTADHGGEGGTHASNKNPRTFTVPFIIWGKPVAKGVDLYKINTDYYADPAEERPDYEALKQPVRNGDAANLALSLLGLPAVENSTIGNNQTLKVN